MRRDIRSLLLLMKIEFLGGWMLVLSVSSMVISCGWLVLLPICIKKTIYRNLQQITKIQHHQMTIKFQLLFLFISVLTITSSSPICTACIKTIKSLQSGIIFLAPQFVARDIVQSVCQRTYQSQELCKDVAKELTPIAIRMGVKGLIKTGRICQYLCPRSYYKRVDINLDMQKITNGKPADFQDILNDLPYPKQAIAQTNNQKTFKILHLTDIHLDLNYTEKASTVCDFPICCHKEDGFPDAQSSKAPAFGSPKCDTPMKLFESALSFISSNLADIDMVMMTGDYSAHNQWQKSKQTVKMVRQLIETKIQSSLHIPVISASGNNEFLPDHQVEPSLSDSIKVFEVYYPDQNTKNMTFVSINTLFCDVMNLYLLEDQTLPLKQLKTLDSIMANHENIYIFGHISPTSSSCSQTYSTLFRSIITKHKQKLKGQFYGHTHLDSFVVNTDPRDNTTEVGYGLLSGSLSPYGTRISRFRTLEVNPSTKQLTNYKDYKFSTTQQQWLPNYDFKQFYNIAEDEDITGLTMSKLRTQIAQNAAIRKQFNSKASGSAAADKFYCSTYDSTLKKNDCFGGGLSFKGKINDLLGTIQGKWGAYGDHKSTDSQQE